MKKKSFISNISLGLSFFQIIIYFLDCVIADNNISYCSSEYNYSSHNIYIERKNFRYISFVSFSNGNMVFLTSYYSNEADYLDQHTRIFYGIKENGRPLFNDSYFFYTYVYEKGSEEKYEGQSLVIRESINTSDTKEYLMSLTKGNTPVEIYDFDNNITYANRLINITNVKFTNYISSYSHALISLNSNDTNYYFLLGFINQINDYEYEYIIQKHLFYSIESFNSNGKTLVKNTTINNIKPIKPESGLSCFQTEKQFIICFLLNERTNYYIIAFDTNLTEINNITLNFNTFFIDNPFYKCLHLKDEIGIFTYYYNSFPVLLFKEFNNSSGFKNYTISVINLNKGNSLSLFGDLLLNDIIKLNNNKIYYCATNTGKEKIYIISIYLYNETYKIRYYKRDLLSPYKIHLEMRLHIYKNFLAIGYSYNSGNENDYNNTLLIYGYPNSTDYNLFLIQNLFENSNHSDIYINLENKTIIENNLFGYEFSGIIVSHLENCDNLNLTSNLSDDIIYPNYTLIKNERIKLKLKNYTKFICNIQYNNKVTEPELKCFDSYATECEGEDEISEQFNTTKEEYIGRLNYYNITLNESLVRDCKDTNCELCLESNNAFCIICKYNNTFSKDIKICLDQVIMIEGIEIRSRELKESKEEFVNNITNVIKSIDIDKNYVMKGEDYTVTIRPTNSSTINSFTHVDFAPCEKILRDYYKISESRIITFLQLEIDNLDSKSVVNQVGYQAFDDKRNPLNLSLCNNTNIQIFYLIKSNSSLDISFISSFKDSNIDLFSLDNEFFTDICFSYSYSENDVVLEDRIKDFYQNFSLCDDGCTYNDINIEYMTITCDCDVKTNLTTTQKVIDLKQLKVVNKSLLFTFLRDTLSYLLYSNCYF